jgi:MarR family 2-MHQ and catechol resistance regulon transcriptional repressor
MMTNTSNGTLRIAPLSGMPLRLRERLSDARLGGILDVIDNPIYRSAMKQVDQTGPPARTTTPPDGAASLFTFLDAADVLYERIAEALARVGLSYAKYEVLKHLRDASEPVSLGTLAEGQRCARSNITQIVDRLETEALVRRVDDPRDRRGVRAELTTLGATLVEEGDTQIDLVRAQFAASFSVSERAELGRLLARIR